MEEQYVDTSVSGGVPGYIIRGSKTIAIAPNSSRMANFDFFARVRLNSCCQTGSVGIPLSDLVVHALGTSHCFSNPHSAFSHRLEYQRRLDHR